MQRKTFTASRGAFRAFVVVLALLIVGYVVTVVVSSAVATGQAVCHPVEGKGETKTGWDIISPNQASKHIDEALYPDGHYWKHETKDGRHDMYATQYGCPGDTPSSTTTTTGSPSSTTTTTVPTTVTSTTTQPTTVTSTTSSTTTISTSSTTSSPSESTSSTSTTSPTKNAKPKPVKTSAPAPSSRTSSPPEELAYTGVDPVGAVLVALALLALGYAFYLMRKRQH